MRTFYNLFLILMLISCPLRCQLGWSDCCGQVTATVESPEVCCCEAEQKLPSAPVQPADESEQCKCICGGATVPDATDLVLDDESHALPCFATSSITCQQPRVVLQGQRVRCGPPSIFSQAPNTGREIRFLLGSLII